MNANNWFTSFLRMYGSCEVSLCDEENSAYISHHGIKGQKWGVRNGPPYPLSRQKDGGRNKAEIEANKRDYISKDSMLGSSKNVNRNETSYRINANQIVTTKPLDCSSDSINPYYEKTRKKSGSEEFVGARMNCGSCAIAWELRKRGIDAKAVLAPDGMSTESMKQAFNIPDKNISRINDDLNEEDYPIDSNERANKMADIVSNRIKNDYPEGSRGVIAARMFYGAHFFNWEYKNGKVVFENPQSSSVDLMKDCFGAITSKTLAGIAEGSVSLYRLDDLETPNFDSKFKHIVDVSGSNKKTKSKDFFNEEKFIERHNKEKLDKVYADAYKEYVDRLIKDEFLYLNGKKVTKKDFNDL